MIAANELKMYRSAVVSDGSTNGGRMSNSEILSAVIANLFPPVSQSERAAGSVIFRKAFHKVANDADEALLDALILLSYNTPGADIITAFPGTQTDTQATITDTEDQYGAGKLNASVSAGVTSIAVLTETGATKPIFRDGDKIRISDKVNTGDVGGNAEIATISGAPSYASLVATLTLAEPLAFGYAAADTRVSSLMERGTIEPTISDFVVTTAGNGDYNSAVLLPDSIGSVEQTWTALFSSATAFGVTGDTLGSVGTGSIAAGITPNNPGFTKPYFVLPPGGFSGTWASGDTIVFKTHPAAAGTWFRRNVPAGSASNVPNSARAALIGNSA